MMFRYLCINIALLTIVVTALGIGWGHTTHEHARPGLLSGKSTVVPGYSHHDDPSASAECGESVSVGHDTVNARYGNQSCELISIRYGRIVHARAYDYSLEPSLVSAVITVESNWNPLARSRSGAMGLMQLMPATAREMGVRDPYDPIENIEGGIKYLRYLLDRFNGDLTLAIAAYNAGPRRIERHQGVPPIRETQQYVTRVLDLYNGHGSNSI